MVYNYFKLFVEPTSLSTASIGHASTFRSFLLHNVSSKQIKLQKAKALYFEFKTPHYKN